MSNWNKYRYEDRECHLQVSLRIVSNEANHRQLQ